MFKQILFSLTLSLFCTGNMAYGANDDPPAYSIDNVVFMDYENNVCFIDLMALDITISAIILTNSQGVEMDQLNCLNVKTKEILEFNLDSMSAGTYILRFETIDGSFTQHIDLR